ncbi:MAG: hypothetical protein COA32_01815 [Fluviicola sp.]|nr:MAG: hypothetical protein COA32_01815 [Fluviicola sp.]
MAGLAFSSWGEKGPNGGYFSHDGYHTYSYSNHPCSDQRIDSLKRYYLYNDCTVGEFMSNSSKKYFIANSDSCYFEIFEYKKNWLDKIDEMDLAPLIWTRWHEGYWKWYSKEKALVFMFLPIIGSIIFWLGIILLVTLLIVTIHHFLNEAPSIRKTKTVIICLLNFSLICFVLLENLPWSI